MVSVVVQWVATLLVSVLGGLIARWAAPVLGGAAGRTWLLLRSVRNYLVGLAVGLGLAASALLADQIPWVRLAPVAELVGIAVFVLWTAKSLRYLVNVNTKQLTMLEQIRDGRVETDGGEVEDRPGNSGAGMVGGALAGGYIGAAFGPHAAVFGAVVGASFGDELEKQSLKTE